MIEVASRFLIANLAAAAAVLLVLLLRKPVRAMFGARLAYALWLLVPLASLASFAPPRVVETVVPSFDLVFEPVSEPAPLPLADPILPAFEAIPVDAQPAAAPPDPWTLAMLGWMAGALAMAAWLGFAQSRFMSDARRGRAGPAVVGVIRPRIVTPADFQDRFDERERDVILAHETIHLDRNDARINAFVALLRCICWFNPLIHVAAHVMRIDQEMACDAMVVERFPRARGLYASALLKAQLAMRPLPLGCYWPAGGDHPLTERIEMLKQTTPGRMRRLAGVACLAVLAAGAGVGAWAAMPPQERFVVADLPPEPPATALPAQVMPEPIAEVTPTPAPQQTRPSAATQPMTSGGDDPLYLNLHGKIEKLEFGASSYVVFVRASSVQSYGPGFPPPRPPPFQPNTALWQLSPTNYFGNPDSIRADLMGKDVMVQGQSINKDCKPDCRIKTRELLFARSTEVPAPKANDSLVAMFAWSYDTSRPQYAVGRVQNVKFHDSNRTLDVYIQPEPLGALPSPRFQVRMEYRHPRADIERELTGKTVTVVGWRTREQIGTYCDPCGMFSDSLEVGDRSGTVFVPRARITPDGPVLATAIPARPAPVFTAANGGPLRIVALKRERLELSSRDIPKFVDRYFEPGEEYLLGGASAGDWTISTPDGSAFEWRAGDASFGPIGAGPVNAQSVTTLSQRAALAAQPAAPQSAPQRATPATPQPTRYEPQQAPPADFVPFASLFDADDPIQVRGRITKIDLTQAYAVVWVQATEATEPRPRSTSTPTQFVRNINLFRVMLGPVASAPDWVNASLVGKDVTVRGYRAKEKTCADECLINGRDIVVDSAKRTTPALQPTSFEPQQAPQQTPLHITSNAGNYLPNEGRAVYTGNVQVTQGDFRLATDNLTVTCRSSASGGCDEIQALIAESNVTFTDPDISIRGNRADYDFGSGLISFAGDVTVRRGGGQVIRNAKAIYNTLNRTITVSGDRAMSTPN